MSHEIEIEGCLTIPDKISLDDVTDIFFKICRVSRLVLWWWL